MNFILNIIKTFIFFSLPTFDQWIVKNNKIYMSLSDYNYRQNIYLTNLITISNHNAEIKEWKMDVNNFADLTVDEFTKKYINNLEIENKNISINSFDNNEVTLINQVPFPILINPSMYQFYSNGIKTKEIPNSISEIFDNFEYFINFMTNISESKTEKSPDDCETGWLPTIKLFLETVSKKHYDIQIGILII
jgi:hypothetical protein